MAKRKTITEKAIEFATLCGYKEIYGKSGKYRTFTKEGVINKIFIGKRGAFRYGKVSSKSRSVYGVSLTHEKIDRLIESKKRNKNG